MDQAPAKRLQTVIGAEQRLQPDVFRLPMRRAELKVAQHDVQRVARHPGQKVGAPGGFGHDVAAQVVAHADEQLIQAGHFRCGCGVLTGH